MYYVTSHCPYIYTHVGQTVVICKDIRAEMQFTGQLALDLCQDALVDNAVACTGIKDENC